MANGIRIDCRRRAEGRVERVDRGERDERRLEELKEVLPKPHADYVPDMPWERRR